MAYSTQSDISPAKLSTEQLKQLTSEDGLSIVASVVTQAIEEADAEIDSYAGRRYVVPMTPVPAKVKQLSTAIAVFKLFEKRASTFAGEIPNAYRAMYDDAMRFLRDVASGKANIEGATPLSQTHSPQGGSFYSNERVFTKDSLDIL